ncbi:MULTISPECIES: amino acid aminotransferase [unclassified Agarivorans]|uniref:amino acid aminotransferase n=1 Tax=unclassified Agarivorans TaxID=2636026 RepID=UPI0026E3DC6B|nr:MULTISPECIES: amino acid aminotransferase [unclassified Agarivorans]MDO6685876.1 amino acid aminotransferase [Agarivorans sp. 3_MG-2023]MDO6713986.1 amino acid aminotransferase [Agarivorans sp. 2_MG-2023]MDO6762317.1 amino acid aminotransferase [Agarivorans sp. 1_MG-2023]
MFERVTAAPADPILGLTEAFKADPRPNKINLGVGIYKNEAGQTPVLATVKIAEKQLLENEATKSYLSIEGNPAYGTEVQKLLFGENSEIVTSQRGFTAQSPGGTGALHNAAEFAYNHLGVRTVWVSNPTWANHGNIFKALGLEVKAYDYYNAETKDLDFDAMLSSLEHVAEGDLVLFHGCCHNPTGIDPTTEQWQQLASLAASKKMLPLFDFAYQGFAKGVEEDAAGLRIFAKEIKELLVASSFSKNFGLYNERVGAFTLVASDKEQGAVAFSQVKAGIRANYSNPPSHGAAVVTTILQNPELKAQWNAEVADMRERIKEMRDLFVATLAAKGATGDYSFIQRQNGMFSFSGLSKEQVQTLKEEHGVYIVGSGRISVAGMTKNNMEALCAAIAAVV